MMFNTKQRIQLTLSQLISEAMDNSSSLFRARLMDVAVIYLQFFF